MRRTTTIALMALALVGAACGGNDDTGTGGGATPTLECTDSVAAGDNFFEPACAEVETDGDVAVVNEGDALHSFTIDDLGVDDDIASGEEISVTIEADPGEYRFYCKYHPEMEGTLTVT
jgi:plastocyanin